MKATSLSYSLCLIFFAVDTVVVVVVHLAGGQLVVQLQTVIVVTGWIHLKTSILLIRSRILDKTSAKHLHWQSFVVSPRYEKVRIQISNCFPRNWIYHLEVDYY